LHCTFTKFDEVLNPSSGNAAKIERDDKNDSDAFQNKEQPRQNAIAAEQVIQKKNTIQEGLSGK